MVQNNRWWLLFLGLALGLIAACSGSTTSSEDSGGGSEDAAEAMASSMTQG